MIIDHIGVGISDYEISKAFYSAALAPLGVAAVMEGPGWAGFGKQGKPEFWIGAKGAGQSSVHIAFVARTREEVDRFYEAAIGAGGRDNGVPGLREIYHPNYYGAFVLDPDGHNVEAVCHLPQS